MPGPAPVDSPKPWRASAAAVRSWQSILGVPAGEDIATARARLEDAAAEVRERYQRNPDLAPEPRRGHPHLYVYRGGLPLRMRVLVDVEAGEIVDVLSLDGNKTKIERYRRAIAGWTDRPEDAHALPNPTPPKRRP